MAMGTKKRTGRAKKKIFDAATEVRAIARERLGRVKPAVVIIPRSERKPKYPPNPFTQD